MTKILVRLLLFLAIILTLRTFSFLIVPLLISSIIAILLHPFAKRLETRYKWGRVPAGLLVVLVAVIVLLILSIVIGVEISNIVAAAPQYAESFASKMQGLISWVEGLLPSSIGDSLRTGFDFDSAVQSGFRQFISIAGAAVSVSANVLSVVLVMPLYIFFILIYREHLIEFSYKLLKKVPTDRIDSILHGIYNVIHKYLRGALTVMLIVGILNSLGLWALGIPSPFFFGFFAAILTIIPYIGVFIGSIIPIIVAFVTTDSLWYPFGCLILFVVVQFLEGNLITPNITGSEVSLNPFAGIASLMFFGWLWGTPGFVIAYPVTAITKVLFDNIPQLNAFGYLLSEFDETDAENPPNTVEKQAPDKEERDE